LITKFRKSDFWATLNYNSVGINPVNSLPWSAQMISELTSSKNVFGHQARDGVCEDGELKLCVCQDLMERLFEHAKDPKFNSTSALLRLVAANIPSGMVYNFPQYGSLVAATVTELYKAHPKILQPLEMLREKKRKQVAKQEVVKEPIQQPIKQEPTAEPGIKQEIPSLECPDFKRRAFYSASFKVTQSSYANNCVKRVEAGIKIGGVDPRDLISAINAIFS
jgi:hypothetical protein